jgi:hypothetical protein
MTFSMREASFIISRFVTRVNFVSDTGIVENHNKDIKRIGTKWVLKSMARSIESREESWFGKL